MHGACDGDGLALAARQGADGLGRVAHVDADVGHRLAGDAVGEFLVDARERQPAPGRLTAEEEIARNAHQRDHAEILEHGRHAERLRVARIAERDRLAVDQYVALVGPVHADENLDQRRLSGTIVAKEAMHLAGIDLDVDILQRAHRAEIDADVAQFHGGGAVGMAGHQRRPPPRALVRI